MNQIFTHWGANMQASDVSMYYVKDNDTFTLGDIYGNKKYVLSKKSDPKPDTNSLSCKNKCGQQVVWDDKEQTNCSCDDSCDWNYDCCADYYT